MTPARPGISVRLLLALAASLLAGLSAAGPGLAAYQSSASAEVTDVNAADFPNMAVRVAVQGESGGHVGGLPASAFALAENGIPVPALSVSSVEVGVQVVFLLAHDETFTKRDSTGTSRYEYIRQSITDFLVDRPWMRNGLDDISIVTSEGPLLLHTTAGVEANAHLLGYEPPTTAPAGPLLTQIISAVELAQPAGPGQGKAAAVVVYASGLSNATPEEIDEAAAHARALGVPVFAFNVSAPVEPEAVNALNLRRLAEGSGGQMIYYTTVESAAPIFEAVAGERMQYLLSYRSHLAESGLPAITVLVRLPGGVEPVTSDPATFSLNVLPPEVGVSGLTPDIRRETTQTPGAGAGAAGLARDVRVAVAFPDGHPREVMRLRLIVDGAPAGEVTEPPFNKITWDLAAAELAAGPHEVQVEVTDELGIAALSPSLQVTITDAQAAEQPAGESAPGALALPWLTIGAGLLGVGLLVGGVWLALRLRPRLFASLSALADRDEGGRRQPTQAPDAPPALDDTEPIVRLSRPAPRHANNSAGQAEAELPPLPPPTAPRRAYLEVLHVGEGSRPPIELNARPVTLGRDPALSAITFVDRSVSRLHARVEAGEDGDFHIFDEGSTSGTWVNYEQVSEKGRVLQHGDLVNLGRVQLRFRLRPVQGAAAAAPGSAGQQPAARPPDDTTIPFKPKRRRWGGSR